MQRRQVDLSCFTKGKLCADGTLCSRNIAYKSQVGSLPLANNVQHSSSIYTRLYFSTRILDSSVHYGTVAPAEVREGEGEGEGEGEVELASLTENQGKRLLFLTLREPDCR